MGDLPNQKPFNVVVNVIGELIGGAHDEKALGMALQPGLDGKPRLSGALLAEHCVKVVVARPGKGASEFLHLWPVLQWVAVFPGERSQRLPELDV